ALAAGELVRILRDEVLWRGEVDPLQELVHRRERLSTGAGLLVPKQRRREGLKDRARRVERCVGVLVHELDRAAESRQVSALRPPHVLALVEETTACRPKESGEQSPRGGLAAAALPDEAHRLARVERERDRVDGRDRPAGCMERAAHPIELDERRHASFSATGISASGPST